MAHNIDLSSKIANSLPPELVNFILLAREVSQHHKQKLYLVGGVVRDLLLGLSTFDLDLVVEGNAIELAQILSQAKQGRVTTHPHFLTAKLQWDNWSIDLTTARSESYARPGALPSVQPGTIESDLFRRDFTINAMAVSLIPRRFGELMDPFGGREDLKGKLVRILHKNSFIDDATRIWRALRYEQRLDFHLEPTTLRLLKRDTPFLDAISGDRIRYEVECLLKEKHPEKALRRADELGVLAKLHPSLKGNGWLAEKFSQARQVSAPEPPSIGLYLALLAYRLTREETEHLISRLRLPKSLSQVLRDTADLKSRLESLADPEIKPSGVYRLLHGSSPLALTAHSLAADSAPARQHISLFLDELRQVKPALNGKDLVRMGIPPGPKVKEILTMLHEAKLDGEMTSKKDEEELVRRWIDDAKKSS